MNIDEVKNICVIGTGKMGTQIALLCALHGYEVNLNDVDEDALDKSKKWISEYLAKKVKKGRISQLNAESAKSKMKYILDLVQAAKTVDIVIEVIIENLEAKRNLMRKLGGICPPQTILATNSSTIVSSKLMDVTSRPDKVLNMHFFNPALVMELVEIVRNDHTSDETVNLIIELAKKLDKTPVLLKKEISGFIANRLLDAIFREGCFLVENGYASIEDVDLAAEKGLRHPMGPFKTIDFTGIDVAYHVRQQRFQESGDERQRPPALLKQKYEAREYGRRTNKGFYDYSKA